MFKSIADHINMSFRAYDHIDALAAFDVCEYIHTHIAGGHHNDATGKACGYLRTHDVDDEGEIVTMIRACCGVINGIEAFDVYADIIDTSGKVSQCLDMLHVDDIVLDTIMHIVDFIEDVAIPYLTDDVDNASDDRDQT